MDVIKDRGRFHVEGPDLTYSGAGRDRISIIGDDPLSARHEASYRITLERAGWNIRTETRSVMTCTKEDFLISATLDAYEDDTRVFTRSWDGPRAEKARLRGMLPVPRRGQHGPPR